MQIIIGVGVIIVLAGIVVVYVWRHYREDPTKPEQRERERRQR